MLNTFDALAQFSENENCAENGNQQQNDTTASVDMSAIINRLNEMETKINELVNKTTDFPTRGKTDDSNSSTGDSNSSTGDSAGADTNNTEGD